jgi:hypothetical protein
MVARTDISSIIPLNEQNSQSTWLCTIYADEEQEQEQVNKKQTPTNLLATDEEERIHKNEKCLAEIIK